MSEEVALEPTRLQMLIYRALDCLISRLGKLRMWVISPDGRYNQQYFEDVKERLEKIKGDPHEPMLFRCSKCRELYILWEKEKSLEFLPVWPEYTEEAIDA